MPARSKSQWKFLFAQERAGRLKPGLAREFASKTDWSSLPTRVEKKAEGFGQARAGLPEGPVVPSAASSIRHPPVKPLPVQGPTTGQPGQPAGPAAPLPGLRSPIWDHVHNVSSPAAMRRQAVESHFQPKPVSKVARVRQLKRLEPALQSVASSLLRFNLGKQASGPPVSPGVNLQQQRLNQIIQRAPASPQAMMARQSLQALYHQQAMQRTFDQLAASRQGQTDPSVQQQPVQPAPQAQPVQPAQPDPSVEQARVRAWYEQLNQTNQQLTQARQTSLSGQTMEQLQQSNPVAYQRLRQRLTDVNNYDAGIPPTSTVAEVFNMAGLPQEEASQLTSQMLASQNLAGNPAYQQLQQQLTTADPTQRSAIEASIKQMEANAGQNTNWEAHFGQDQQFQARLRGDYGPQAQQQAQQQQQQAQWMAQNPTALTQWQAYQAQQASQPQQQPQTQQTAQPAPQTAPAAPQAAGQAPTTQAPAGAAGTTTSGASTSTPKPAGPAQTGRAPRALPTPIFSTSEAASRAAAPAAPPAPAAPTPAASSAPASPAQPKPSAGLGAGPVSF